MQANVRVNITVICDKYSSGIASIIAYLRRHVDKTVIWNNHIYWFGVDMCSHAVQVDLKPNR